MEYPSPYAPPALDEMDTVVRKYELGHMQFGGRSEVYTYTIMQMYCNTYLVPTFCIVIYLKIMLALLFLH